ncbi:MAG: hypothetical protein WCR58_06655 [Bacteroidales bacterium]|nr:hypothetical protein [Bacteroidales bacterium]MDD3701964.1 hypothetical protein [Bacteroidales bacterium]
MKKFSNFDPDSYQDGFVFRFVVSISPEDTAARKKKTDSKIENFPYFCKQ